MTESHHPEQEISLPVRVSTLPASPDGLSLLACLVCHKPLDLHQPDAALPGRMLATCSACSAWHLIDCEPEPGGAWIVLLPDFAQYHKAFRAGRPAPKLGPRPGAGVARP